jgi:hypothetical protein
MEGSSDSVRVQTARAGLASYSALQVEALLQLLDHNFNHKVLQSSLEMPSRDMEASKPTQNESHRYSKALLWFLNRYLKILSKTRSLFTPR